ncbi:MAG: YARHG domain-containing protein [Bacteroidota bacterium]|nr:YARHG domain-containing protein [Bacteroidota bacterium]
MKKLFILLLILIPFVLRADDTVVKGVGSTLVPVRATKIQLKKEILELNVKKDTAEVSVYFEFFNPSDEVELTVGFVTPPVSNNDDEETGPFYEPPISKFTVIINGESTSYKKQVLGKTNFSNLKNKKAGFFAQDYIYYFTCKFHKGLNVIKHTYEFECVYVNDGSFEFPYMLTTGKMWANQEMEDFTLKIHSKEYQYFEVPKSFLYNDKKSYWAFNGKGKMAESDEKSAVFIKEGSLEYHKDHFKPDIDLMLVVRHPLSEYGINSDDFTDMYHNELFDYENMTLSRLNILRNTFYAQKGYLFKDPKLNEHFNKMIWYQPDSSKTIDEVFKSFSEEDKKQILLIKKAENWLNTQPGKGN